MTVSPRTSALVRPYNLRSTLSMNRTTSGTRSPPPDQVEVPQAQTLLSTPTTLISSQSMPNLDDAENPCQSAPTTPDHPVHNLNRSGAISATVTTRPPEVNNFIIPPQ